MDYSDKLRVQYIESNSPIKGKLEDILIKSIQLKASVDCCENTPSVVPLAMKESGALIDMIKSLIKDEF